MTRQTQQLETSMFVRSWGLALNSTSHVHRPIHRAAHPQQFENKFRRAVSTIVAQVANRPTPRGSARP